MPQQAPFPPWGERPWPLVSPYCTFQDMKTPLLPGPHPLSVQHHCSPLHGRPWVGFGHFQAHGHTPSARHGLPPDLRDDVSTASARVSGTQSSRCKAAGATFQSIPIRQPL